MRSWKGRSQSGLDYSGADMYHIWEEEEGVFIGFDRFLLRFAE